VNARLAVLAPALLVAAGAVAATAHGGYEVAIACQVPAGFVGSLYPIITDGLALVAYAATHRLPQRSARRYAWAVVILAAALSGLAQAVYLASGPALVTSAALRFGVGAWPAVAGAVAAHLVYLLAHRAEDVVEEASEETAESDIQTVADLVAERAEPERVPLRLAPEPPNATPTPPAGISAVKKVSPARTTTPVATARVGDVDERASELIAAGAGRRRLSRELGVSEYEARTLLEQAKP
jgi:hypothetical protein